MKIVICGSMTASKEMIEAEKKLKELGHEVVLPEFTYIYASMDTADEMHAASAKNKLEYDLIKRYFEKIKESDAVLVVNVEKNNIKGYIGGNAFLEMGFALILNKAIYLSNEIPQLSYRDEIEAMNPIVLNGDLTRIK
jgi:nucleoside 2-deoxyribosyltransferase